MLKNRFRWLGLHTAICRAPDDFSGFGALTNDNAGGGNGQGQDGGDNGFANGGQQGDLIGVGGDQSQTDPMKDVFDMFADPDGDDDDDDTGGTPVNTEIPQDQINNMQTLVKNTIANMRITDDMLPADFDPSDRTQMTAVMNKLMQSTVAQSMNVVFQPVQLAMKQMAATLQAQIDSKVSESRTGMRDQQVLESMVPEVNDPAYAPMVKTMDATLKQKGRNAKDRATAIRKMLNQMGVKSSGNGANSRRTSNPNGDGGNGAVRTGHAALDSFFGAMPSFTQGGNGGRK